MLFRALAAFVALPGLVAFAIPLTIGISTDHRMRHQMLAAMPLCFGTILLLWCAREFYNAGRGSHITKGIDYARVQ